MTDEREIDLTIDVPGSITDVWRAVATGPGISSWFVPCQVEERMGGQVTLDFAEMGSDRGEVTVWEPPTRFAYRGGSGADGPSLSFEWHIAESDADGCTVRLLNGGFSGDGAEQQAEGMAGGWRIYLENLRLHLTHFPGLEARAITPTVMVPGDNETAWAELCSAMDLQVDLGEGAHFTTSGEGVPMLIGTIEKNLAVPGKLSAYLVRTEAPGAGTAFIAAEGGGEATACSVWLYLYDEDRDEIEDRWTPFLRGRWGSPG